MSELQKELLELGEQRVANLMAIGKVLREGGHSAEAFVKSELGFNNADVIMAKSLAQYPKSVVGCTSTAEAKRTRNALHDTVMAEVQSSKDVKAKKPIECGQSPEQYLADQERLCGDGAIDNSVGASGSEGKKPKQSPEEYLAEQQRLCDTA